MLKHPTLAQQAADAHSARTKTRSFNYYAEKFGGVNEIVWPPAGPSYIEWIFEDDSTVRVYGRGKNHKLEVHLP